VERDEWVAARGGTTGTGYGPADCDDDRDGMTAAGLSILLPVPTTLFREFRR
jgi:hypothetical protein